MLTRRRAPDRKVVVITGASAGVGRALARELATQGHRIALLARGREGLEGARRDVEAAGGEGLVIPTDVADADAVERAAEQVESTFGPIDLWINNAMVSVFSYVHDLTPEEVARVTAVTYQGVVHGTLSALRRMRRRDRGTILQVGSALAYRGIPLQAAYCGAKHAVKGFTESLRTELMAAHSHVRLCIVQLPALNTPQFGWSRTRLGHLPRPVPPIFSPEVAARAIVWAADSGRPEVFVGGPTVKTVLGEKFASQVAARYLARNGIDAQLGPEVEASGEQRPDNLFEPVEGDRGAHGPYADQETEVSLQMWANRHRGALAAAAGVLVGGALAWASARNGHAERSFFGAPASWGERARHALTPGRS